MDLSKCTKEIVKIAENNVEVQYSLYTGDGEKVVVSRLVYGHNRIESEKASIQAELDRLSSYKIDVKTLDSLISVQQKKMEDVLAIESIEKATADAK